MGRMMPAKDQQENTSSFALASTIVLKLREFIRKPVAEQVKLKARIEALVGEVIRPLPSGSRIVLDAPDGAAIVVLGGPKDALDVAQRLQAGAAELPLCIGVNHGPVKPVADEFRGQVLVGDGLATAMTLWCWRCRVAVCRWAGRWLVPSALRSTSWWCASWECRVTRSSRWARSHPAASGS